MFGSFLMGAMNFKNLLKTISYKFERLIFNRKKGLKICNLPNFKFLKFH